MLTPTSMCLIMKWFETSTCMRREWFCIFVTMFKFKGKFLEALNSQHSNSFECILGFFKFSLFLLFSTWLPLSLAISYNLWCCLKLGNVGIVSIVKLEMMRNMMTHNNDVEKLELTIDLFAWNLGDQLNIVAFVHFWKWRIFF